MSKVLMIQGTMSNVGKSLIVAGLCRLFRNQGLRVAPFKSQNMALNSAVTKEGLEMGRAQVMQAEAARIEPGVDMNPILLKPLSDKGSQVIVEGKVIGNMQAKEYFAYKKDLRPIIQAAYSRLSRAHDLIIIEGAGSPAEINLAHDDIVNMGMAHMASAPVLLVGDIDPGGVFAQMYGTMQLLMPEDRGLVKGLIVNKFRGDVDILRPGIRELEELCGVPVAGVVPYADLDLDDEDSLAPRLNHVERNVIDVAVIRLPHLSNFTDFNHVARHEKVGLRYVDKAEDIARPDLVIIPGTKNTLHDMCWLQESGIASCIKSLAENNTPILGICGGYQMLGDSIEDTEGVEGGGSERGLGLLPLVTTLAQDKTLSRSNETLCIPNGIFSALDGLSVSGYEIHMGKTGTVLCGPHGPHRTVPDNVWGTYLHGLFDEPELVNRLIDALLEARGLPLSGSALESSADYKNRQYDRLAYILSENLDMQLLNQIIQEGV